MAEDRTGRKIYTEEEILEMGRKTLAKHKITVFVVLYKHKHGEDISVYGGLKSAQESARDLMANRMAQTWDRHDVEHMEALADFDDQLSHFIEVEAGISYGETIEILERRVG